MGVLARTWVWPGTSRPFAKSLSASLSLCTPPFSPALLPGFFGHICRLSPPYSPPDHPLSTLTWGRGLNYPLGKEETEISYPRNSPSPTPPGCGRDPAASRALPSPTRKSSSCRRRFCGCKIGEGASDDLHNKELTGGGGTLRLRPPRLCGEEQMSLLLLIWLPGLLPVCS